jgi:predicted transcriptional regulator
LHKNITFRIQDETLQRLGVIIATKNVTRSRFINEAIENAILNYQASDSREKVSSRRRKRMLFRSLKDALRQANFTLLSAEKNFKRTGFAMSASDIESQVDPLSIPTARARERRLAATQLAECRVAKTNARQALLDSGFAGQIPGEPSTVRSAAAKLAHVRRKEEVARQELEEVARLNHD